MTARALIVGGARSGSGKTSVSVGLMRALARRGLAVRGAKSGPDYIDPGFHAAATGAPGVNLDSWAMPPGLLDRLVGEQAAGADVLVIESAMGLFDGIVAEPGRSGAAADLARRYGVPVVLVLDVSGQSQTAAAIARGFATHDPEVRVAGVILNQVASARHERLVRDAIAAIGAAGGRGRAPQPGDGAAGAAPRAGAGARARGARGLHRAGGRRHGRGARPRRDPGAGGADRRARAGAGAALLPPPGQRIAVAEDAAFSFVYPHLVRHWRAEGAELVPFSPLADEGPDPSCDACWLPGGYPELHAGRLARPAASAAALRRLRGGRGRCMASAAASWCSGGRSRTRTA